MHARLTIVKHHGGPGLSAEMEKLADEITPRLKSMKGFHSAIFFGDPETGDGGALTLWEEQGHAEAAHATLAPQLGKLFGERVKEPPSSRIFKVYEPKA